MTLSKELNMGRAGEYIVLADLLLNGYQAFDSGQGASYDLILENKDGKLIKIQVKTTEKIKQWDSKTNKKNNSYFFHTKRCGKNGTKKYNEKDFDLYALVMLDIRKIAYLPFKGIHKNSITLLDKNNANFAKQKSLIWQNLTLEKALKELENERLDRK